MGEVRNVPDKVLPKFLLHLPLGLHAQRNSESTEQIKGG